MSSTVIVNGKRTCIQCGKILTIDNFYKYGYTTNQGNRSYRYDGRCKECSYIRRSIRYFGNREAQIVRRREYHEKYRLECNRRLREYRLKNIDKVRRQRVISEQKRRGKGLSRVDINIALDLYKFGDKFLDVYSMELILRPTVDHIIPLQSGGGLEYDNLCPTSRSNNSSKHNKTLFRWLCGRGLG